MSNEKGESKRVVLKINVSFRIILRASLKSSFPVNANIPLDGSRFRSRSRNELFSFHRSNKIFCTISILILKFRRACKNYPLITRGLKIRSFFIYIKMFEGSFFFLSEIENYAIYNPRYYNPFFFPSILLFIRNQFYPKGVSYF